MGFRNNAFATVWSVEPRGNITTVRLSTSRKNKDSGEYTEDFSGFCTFIGNAHKLADKLKERDRIRIDECEVTTTYNREKKTNYTNFNVYSFDWSDTKNNNMQTTGTAKKTPNRAPVHEMPEFEGDPDDENVPF